MLFYQLFAATAFASDGFVALPITRNTTDVSSIKETASQFYVSELLPRGQSAYFAHFSLGGQKQTAYLDTGSADLWVYGKDTGAELTYEPTENTQLVDDTFRVRYVDGLMANGSFYIDNFTWGGLSLDLQFGVTDLPVGKYRFGIFGIGDKSRETNTGPEKYDNFPARLKKLGLTHTASYSLDLGPLLATEGQIVFGAIDTTRFTGKLKLFDVNLKSGYKVAFRVLDLPNEANLDSGTDFTYLDASTVWKIAEHFGAEWVPKINAFRAPTDTLPAGNLVFSFYGVNVTVPSQDLWITIKAKGQSALYLTIFPNWQSRGQNILGDNFLRSAYVVHDLDNSKVAVGQSSQNFGGPPNYELIKEDGIPAPYLDLRGFRCC